MKKNNTTHRIFYESFENKRHILSVDQFNIDSLEHFFSVVEQLIPIAKREKKISILDGAILANLFFEASTRTRISFGAAFRRLGGSVCDTTGFTFSSFSKGESIPDTSRVIGEYVDAIVIRHPKKGAAKEFSRATNIPLINGGDGTGEHPSQALLDLYTIKQKILPKFRTINSLNVAFAGDLKNGRTVHSLIKLLALYKNIKFSLISPPGLELPEEIKQSISKNGHYIEEYSDIRKGFKNANIIYATRIQKERLTNEEQIILAPEFCIKKAIIDQTCKSDTLIMHPLPRDSSPGAIDLNTDLDNDPRLIIFEQAANGIPVRMALFAILLDVIHLIPKSMKNLSWSIS